MVACQDAYYLQTDMVPISVELAERRWTLLGHMLWLPADTPASRAVAQYFRKTFVGGEKREVRRSSNHLRDDHGTRRVPRPDDSEGEERSGHSKVSTRSRLRQAHHLRTGP